MILIAGTDLVTAADLEQRLKRLGYNVTGMAATAAQVAALVSANPPDLIAADLDLHTPGFEQSLDSLCIPVVWTGQGNETSPSPARLFKPFEDREIRAVLDLTLSHWRTERALRKSEAKYRKLHESMRDAFVSVALTGEILEYNAAYRAMLGYSDEELMRLTFMDLTPPRWHESEAVIVRDHILKLGASPVYEKEYQRKDGTVFPVELRAFLIRDDAGKPASIWGIARDITERKEAELVLLRSLDEKEVLLKEVHHRVKNNLQIVTSLLSLQAARLHDPALTAALLETGNRVRSMALLHETLYQSGNLAALNFSTYLRNLCAHLARSFGPESGARVRLDVRLGEVHLDLDRAISCGLLVNELICNAFKHGYPGERSGCLTVALRQDPAGIHIKIADDGAGLPPELDLRQARTLGMRLVNSLAAQLHGVLDIQSTPGAGAAITVTIPPAPPAQRA